MEWRIPASLRAIIGDGERFFRALEILCGSNVSSGSLSNDPPVKRNVLANIYAKSPNHIFKLDEIFLTRTAKAGDS